MAEDIAASGEAEDDLLFSSPFLMYFDGTFGDKVDARYGLAFFEDGLSLSEL